MSATFTSKELKAYIDRIAERLPRHIMVEGKKLSMDIKYFGGLENHWVLSYGTENPEDTFIHRDEATLETCVLGAWRNLALRKNEWEPVND